MHSVQSNEACQWACYHETDETSRLTPLSKEGVRIGGVRGGRLPFQDGPRTSKRANGAARGPWGLEGGGWDFR
eukprot:CAMPEP_0206507822 /NCGR_PEP_ID=MMETSP0324_2-20121206/57828_1 /ASSEMBLY_ACC=CAM_ASM_000836 /TAXON_ID=2866 /ORGANISM="Crypthecodinium cohnii, Strain Seligo" /LENGTH=72 /DNA_ID=CAMNT_0053998293 /DNA_START=53 /DNA_END=267 /DNA_ORIENTATION=-